MSHIKSIKFGLLSPAMIKKMASVEITVPELYDSDGFPIDNGLCDLRLGVIDPGMRCKVCGGTIGQCLGHFGYMELVKPVVNPLYGKVIFNILRTICRKCSRLLVDEDEVKKSGLKGAYKKAAKTCKYCGEKQKDISFEKPTTYFEGRRKITPEDIRERLEKITDRDAELLKIKGGRPEWMILTVLPIPPVTIRPSITLETGGRSEDDLTHKLVDVVRINERLKKNIELGAPDFIILDIWELLQYHVSTLIDNEIANIPPARHRSGRALKTLVQRLEKKEGRFRGNLTGKRVNFAARAVISPDTRISLNEVGVPLCVAKELTVPEMVNKINIGKMRDYVLNGENYPGANYVIKPDGTKKKVTEENKKEIAKELDIGYIVERHLVDGDITMFNRQPSLHRMSMMAHRARITPWRTFTLNLTATIPYNADFDGDEMNLHVPQDEEARTEAEMLMLVQNNIRSPRYGLPIIACKHDHISGSYLLTKEKKIDKKDVAQLLLNAFGPEFVMNNISEMGPCSGKEIFSLLLPEGLNIEFRSATCMGCNKCQKEKCPYDAYVVIKNGRLLKGVIDENALGEKKGKLLNRIEKQFGPDVAGKFLDSVSKLVLEFLTKKGFSISISDCDISKHAENMLNRAKEKTDETNKQTKKHKEDWEKIIIRAGNEIVNKCGEIVKNDIKENNIIVMVKSGARGSYVTVTQTSGVIGQKVLAGKLMKRGYTNRTTSHFVRGNLDMESHGFIKSNYKNGLSPIEFFFDAASSRENLMDKSLQTKHSGYMERRLINALQDLKVESDFTVRDSRHIIVQFVPGEDGIDPAKSDGGSINMEILE
ncbi:MAG: DNA-directed RNA polymerase subunit A' [Candidatus Aenigmarchaeota archaeon]|nr:DNA-directed RNA polymerase subunit A' [Candidatus Aenigmarchaeota archaeon]